MQIRNRPYNLLLLAAMILFLTSFLLDNRSNSADLHLHDTYFVVSYTHIFWLFAIVALVIWSFYLLINKILYAKALTWAHVVITILALGLLASTLFWGDDFSNPAPKRYYDYSTWNSLEMNSGLGKVISIAIFVLLFGQIIFVINFIAGLFKWKT